MSATTHAIAAYAVSIILLWGYAMTLWLSCRRRRGTGQYADSRARGKQQ